MSNEVKMIPWGLKEKEDWFYEQTIKRSYHEEVVTRIHKNQYHLNLIQYGSLSLNPTRYQLYLLTTNIDSNKRTILITGGVHGYETSGVHGALDFMEKYILKYSSMFNFVCAPCISPWAYETINRWNNKAMDPNRSFYSDSPSEECHFFLKAISKLNLNILAHFDLHETTDTDNSVFRPTLEKRDGKVQELTTIPDGFYVVGNINNPQHEFQKAVIESVKKITHITPHDENGMIIGVPIKGEGIIYYDMKKLFLCAGFSNAQYSTTTEVYPDSLKMTDEICNRAQVAAICGGLDYLL